MAQIDTLLRVLVRQGGDSLELEAGTAPRMLKGDTELNLCFPATSAAIHGIQYLPHVLQLP